MAMQYGVDVRNARLDQVEVVPGTSPKLQLRSGAPPADCAAADSGTLLAELTLPADWMAAAAAGSKAKNGTWSGTGAAAGNIGHFRLKNSAATVCHIQGTVTATAGGGDMEADNVNVAIGQTVTVTAFTLTGGNA